MSISKKIGQSTVSPREMKEIDFEKTDNPYFSIKRLGENRIFVPPKKKQSIKNKKISLEKYSKIEVDLHEKKIKKSDTSAAVKELSKAIENGDDAFAEKIARKTRFVLHEKDENGEFPVEKAIRMGNLPLVEKFLNLGVNLSQRGKEGLTIVEQALATQDPQCIEVILKQIEKESLNSSKLGQRKKALIRSILHYMVRENIFKLKTENPRYFMEIIIKYGDLELVKTATKRGFPLPKTLSEYYDHEFDPEVLFYLLKKGVKLNSDDQLVQFMNQNPQFVRTCLQIRKFPQKIYKKLLRRALMNNDTDFADYICNNYGLGEYIKSKEGKKWLEGIPTDLSSKSSLEWVMKKGVGLPVIAKSIFSKDYSISHLSRPDVMQFLIEKGLDLDEKIDGLYPYEFAIMGKQFSLATTMISKVNPDSLTVLFSENRTRIKEKELIEITSLLIQKRAKITNETILIAIERGNPEILSLLLKNLPPSTQLPADQYFLAAIRSDNTEMLSILSDTFPNSIKSPVEILKIAISENQEKSVSWILKTFYQSTPIDLEKNELTKVLTEVGNLSFFNLFKVDPNDLPQVTNLLNAKAALNEKEKKELTTLLMKFFINSPTKDSEKFIDALIEQCKNSQENQKFVRELKVSIFSSGALIARYVHPKETKEMKKVYGKNSKISFEEAQLEFGETFYQIAKKGLDFMKKEALLSEIFRYFSSERETLAQQRQSQGFPQYNFYRFDAYEINMNTPIETNANVLRYSFVIPLIQEIQIALKNEQKIPGIAQEEDGYTLTYDLPSGETVNLTNVNRTERGSFEWNHAGEGSQNLLKCWSELQRQHKELSEMKVTPNNTLEFHEKMAEAYWLGSNIMITARGNAQYMLMWQAMMYAHHGFSAPISSRELPQLDCVAISVPLKQFKKDYMTYFERLPELYQS